MKNNSELIKFLENISKGKEPLSLSYTDFFPIESIIDYRTITFNNEITSIEYSDYCRENTNEIVVNINVTKDYSFEITQKIIKLIRSQFRNKNIELEMGEQLSENENETTVDILLYK